MFQLFNMKKLIFFLLLFLTTKSFSQVYQEMPQYGYRANRFAFDSTLQIPTTCGVPTLKSVVSINKKSAIAYDSCNSKFYTYNPITQVWSEVGGGSGSGSDTSKVVIAQVHNETATTLLRGEVVYLFGSTGNVASVKRANNKQDVSSSKTFGIVRRDIPAGGTGFVTTQGQIEKLNLGSYNEGDVLWLDSLDGQFTKVKPQAPYHGVFIGIVERANNGNGLAYIKPQNGYELNEIHDVKITTPLNNQIIAYSDTQSIWKNRNVYSVVDTASTIATKTNLNNYVNLTTAQTIAGQKTFSSQIKMPATGSQLILQVNNDGTINGMSTTVFPSPSELAYVKGVTSAVQTQINSKVNISDTASMLSPYLRTNTANANFLSKVNVNDTAAMLSPYAKNNLVATKLNATDTASLSNRINNKQTDLDLLQLMSYGIKAEPYGVTLANMTGQQGLTTNRFYLYPFNWNVSDTLRGVAFFMRSAFTNTPANYNGIAIYSLSGGTLNRIVFSANNGAFWNATINTWVVQSITPTFLSKGIYFIGYQFSGAGTPTIGSGDPLIIASTQSPSEPPNTSTINPNGIKFSTFITNLTSTPPSSIAMSATTAVVNVPYFLFF